MDPEPTICVSPYVNTLSQADKDRYLQKLRECGISCPYLIPPDVWKTGDEFESSCPPVTSKEIYAYLIHKKSSITASEFRAFKSLEAGRLAVQSGWVTHPSSYVLRDKKVLLSAKVSHSQALSLPPLQPWIIVEHDGQVVSAHCTCVAGYVKIVISFEFYNKFLFSSGLGRCARMLVGCFTLPKKRTPGLQVSLVRLFYRNGTSPITRNQ